MTNSRGLRQNNMRFFPTFLSAGLLCLGMVLSGSAQAADKNPCSDEIARFCKNVKPGMVTTMDCLEEHESELSPACKEYEAKMGGGRIEKKERIRNAVRLRRACKDDVVKFCASVKGYDETVKCLNEHEKELSGLCSGMLKTPHNPKEYKKLK